MEAPQSLKASSSSALEFPHRLNLCVRVSFTRKYSNPPPSYDKPPSDDITLEDFEVFAIDRLRVLAEIESAIIRNKPPQELKKDIETHCDKYLHLKSNGHGAEDGHAERRKDHISHFVLRLAFCRSYVLSLPPMYI